MCIYLQILLHPSLTSLPDLYKELAEAKEMLDEAVKLMGAGEVG